MCSDKASQRIRALHRSFAEQGLSSPQSNSRAIQEPCKSQIRANQDFPRQWDRLMESLRKVQERSLLERVVFPFELCGHLGLGGSTGRAAARLALLFDKALLVARLAGA